LRRGITPEINAVSTIIFIFSLITIVFWYRLRLRSEATAEAGIGMLETSEEAAK
jgi:ABC-type spermidine/putrescine transport system permease subunit II